MINKTSYDRTLIDRIIEVLRNQEGFNYFKKFYHGDPYDIPLSNMPCVVVELQRTRISSDDAPTGMDHIQQTIQIKLIYNKREDYGSTNTSEVTGVRTLESFAQGIDPSSGEYESHTVLGILRKNFTLDNVIVDQAVDIQYGIVPRKDAPTSECHITFIADELAPVSGRT